MSRYHLRRLVVGSWRRRLIDPLHSASSDVLPTLGRHPVMLTSLMLTRSSIHFRNALEKYRDENARRECNTAHLESDSIKKGVCGLDC